MARFNALLQAQARAPAAQEQLFQAARGLAQSPGMLLQQRQTRQSQAEIQDLLKQHVNDPEKLQELSNQYRARGNEKAAESFANAAKAAQLKKDEQTKALREKGELALFNMARMMQASPDEDISRSNLKRQSYLSIAEGYGVSAKRAEEILNQSIDKDKEGSKAANQVSIEEVVENGKTLKYAVTIDKETGQMVGNKVLIGEVAGEAGERGRDAWKNPEIEAYNDTVAGQRGAASEARKYDALLRETIELAGEAGQITDGVGGFFGMARDFVISDVAGLGDAITVHRSRLNEVRMKNAIALLPRGPASDRDVKLALDASVDPKNLNAEDRIRYIRGMKKIADAEKAYMDGKLRWIEQTGDPLAFGYERKVSLDGLNNQIDALESDFPEQVAILKSEIAKAMALDASGDKAGANALIAALKEQDSIGYIEALDMRAAEQQRYNAFVEANNIQFY